MFKLGSIVFQLQLGSLYLQTDMAFLLIFVEPIHNDSPAEAVCSAMNNNTF